MENRIYYGQFTLMHWIRLMLTKDIVLPPYQRKFVWGNEAVKSFISAFDTNLFVPPVAIGRYKTGPDIEQNIILDGQQRLTSLLLAYIDKMPRIGGDAEWRFSSLLLDDTHENKKEKILSRIPDDDSYEDLSLAKTDEFFQTHYLGYSFIVPDASTTTADQQAFYSSVFLKINSTGTLLSYEQSREAMYYFHDNLTQLFKPGFEKIEINGQSIDFPRYLALLSQYKKEGNNERNLARGTHGRVDQLNKYILSYIDSVNHRRNEDDSQFGKFDDTFPGNTASDRLQQFKSDLAKLFPAKENVTSIIDADMWMFGLTHFILFDGKKLKDDADVNELKNKISTEIAVFKGNQDHSTHPNDLQNIKLRVRKSIDIYQNYVS